MIFPSNSSFIFQNRGLFIYIFFYTRDKKTTESNDLRKLQERIHMTTEFKGTLALRSL